jgi:hypothetical protein
MGRKAKEQQELSAKTELVKDKIRDYLESSWEDLIQDIDSLEPKERVDRRMKLLEYVMPKVQATKDDGKRSLSAAQSLLNMESEFDDWMEEDTPIKDELEEEDL